MSLENPSGKERFFNFPAFRLRPRWTLDSQSLVSINFGGGNLWETNLESGERRQITNFITENLYRFDVSPDGRFYVFSRGNYFTDAVLIER
jgi:Tol biopolymer transport system component